MERAGVRVWLWLLDRLLGRGGERRSRLESVPPRHVASECPHSTDHLAPWLAGEYHRLPFTPTAIEAAKVAETGLEPTGSGARRAS